MNNKPIKTFRDGAVGLSVWERQGKSGAYFDFTLSRSYRDAKKGQGYTGTFREDNGDAVIRVVSEATAWIRGQQHERSGAEQNGRETHVRSATR